MNRWKQATYWGISTSGDPDADDAAFNAGHINDILKLDETPFTTILVAGETSGVWIVNQTGGIALPLSDSWTLPNLNSLARGTRGTRHVYAGGDALHETDVTTFAPFLNWQQIPIVDADGNALDAGFIIDMVVIPRERSIVLACSNGIFWSRIPASGNAYAFTQVPFLPGGAYSGVAEGPGSTVVAAAWGSDKVNHFGLFQGQWMSGQLLFQRASIFGNINDSMMLRTSVDSCRSNLSVMYAVAGGDYVDSQGNLMEDTIYRVLRSIDGGQSWKVAGKKVVNSSDPLFGDPTKNLPGNQQDWNNCIAVSPVDPKRVAIGWRNGYFLSTDSGTSWTFISADSSPHLHGDVHAVVFDQFDQAQQTIYIGSDGGLATTPDAGGTHTSQCNRQLPNLQFDRIAASYHTAGLLAGSLQDNGDEFSTLYPNPAPWRLLEGGDGTAVAFIRNGHLLHRNNTETWNNIEYGNRVREAEWQPSSSHFKDMQYFPSPPLSWGVIPIDGTNDGLPFPDVLEIVNNPTWKNQKQELMLGLGGKDNQVYGLFRTSSGGVHWMLLATIPAKVDKTGKRVETISAAGSSEGDMIFVGTDKGRVFKVTAPKWSIQDVTPGGNTNAIERFVVQSNTLVFATASGQTLFKRSGSSWTSLAAPPGAVGGYTAIETDWTAQPKTLFLSTDTRVYASTNEGQTWVDMSNGLPETPHCRDLRFVTETSGAHFLYLATYGRSVFRFLLNGTERQIRRVTITGKMDMVDRQAFGHDIWAHPHFSNGVVLGPEHPIDEVMIAEEDGDEIRVELGLHLQWFMDGSIEVQYTVKLIAKDEDNAIDDQKSGSFKLASGDHRDTVEDLVSDEFWPDRAHIEFTTTN